MIQRIQTLYLTASVVVSILFYVTPFGQIESDPVIAYTVLSYHVQSTQEVVQMNYLLCAVLDISILLQVIIIFMFKNRPRQMLLTQISLIILLGFAVLTLLHTDLVNLSYSGTAIELPVDYNFNVIFLGIPWISTYLALRAIRKDEALVRSSDRLR